MYRFRLMYMLILTICSFISYAYGSKVFQNGLRGYIVYCPCMGRFGNQAEQLLGSLMFAKALRRTLVLPPFINYGLDHHPVLVPFESIIQVDPIKNYHDVMLLSDFMKHNASFIWPEGSRKFYCYSVRDSKTGFTNEQSKVRTCDALKGQPFYTFWTAFNISEDNSIFYKPLSTSYKYSKEWMEEFPASKHPVLAFVGAPSPFPTHKQSISIQKHIMISDYIKNKTQAFKERNNFQNEPYLSMHIRHGSDWRKACDLLRSTDDGLTELFSSNQCAHSLNENSSKLHYELCLPSFETIFKKLSDLIRFYQKERKLFIKFIHIATDYHDQTLWNRIKRAFSDKVFIITPQAPVDPVLHPYIDLYLMANADVFIGNCISSFTAFAARIRKEQANLVDDTYYFAQEDISSHSYLRDDL